MAWSPQTEAGLKRAEAALRERSATAAGCYRSCLPQMSERVGEVELVRWARNGASLARGAFRGWETAVEYMKASPSVADRWSFADMERWFRAGKRLLKHSVGLSSAYFRTTVDVLPRLEPDQVTAWALAGRQLFESSPRGLTLATAFFEQGSTLYGHLDAAEVRLFVRLLRLLAPTTDVALASLSAAVGALPRLEERERRPLLELLLAVAAAAPTEVPQCTEAAPRALARVSKEVHLRFLSLAQEITHRRARAALSYLVDGSRGLTEVPWDHHGSVLDEAARISRVSPLAAVEFLKMCPVVLRKLRMEDLHQWVEEGLDVAREGREGGEAYFRLESGRAEEVLQALSRSVELEQVRDVVRLYCKALTARNLHVRPTTELTARGIGWSNAELPTTEGSSIYLPPVLQDFDTKEKNFAGFKVLATHQAGHLEFGSFDFEFDRPCTIFSQNLRQELAAQKEWRPVEPVSDMERFFDLFGSRRLAADLFTVIEDGRVDSRIQQEYAGIRSSYRMVQQHALRGRREGGQRSLWEVIVETLLRLSLAEEGQVEVPEGHQEAVSLMARTMRLAHTQGVCAEDSAEAALRVYAIMRTIRNQPEGKYAITHMDAGTLLGQGIPSGDEMDLLFAGFLTHGGSTLPEMVFGIYGDDVAYKGVEKASYRGEFKPELVQAMMRLRIEEESASKERPMGRISTESLRRLFEKSAEVDIAELSAGDVQSSSGMFVTNLVREVGRDVVRARTPPQPQRYGEPPGEALAPADGGERVFLYDEWDFRADDFRPDWCLVREKVIEEGSLGFYQRTLQERGKLAAQIRRQFEALRPEVFRKIKRLQDGEDFTLDAVIEALIERRAGTPPDEKIYWRRNKVERDVVVALLLDMSASTDELVSNEQKKREVDDLDWHDDPRAYVVEMLRRRAEREATSKEVKIIDVEKESAVLLIGALEAIGDRYGIYGFSGYGRDDVEFFVIKDIDEAFDDAIRRRIDKIRPVRGTRMGAALRHTIYKLGQHDAKVKVLMLVSDGRPQDFGYGRDGTEKDYAIHDTRMALYEARRNNIVPFCLTVDKEGHDYLKDMCQDMGYEVLDQVEMLPERLPTLYRELTM